MEFWSVDPISDKRFDDTPPSDDVLKLLESPHFAAGFRNYEGGVPVDEGLDSVDATDDVFTDNGGAA